CLVSPDYNGSAIHCDHFLQIQAGTDALLAMGLARLLVENGWVDKPYVLEQTDLPLLVRADTGKFLRESDLKEGGSEEVFYFWDRRTDRGVAAPGSMGLVKKDPAKATIRLGDVEPALEGAFGLRLRNGEIVQVTTVF